MVVIQGLFASAARKKHKIKGVIELWPTVTNEIHILLERMR